MVLNYNQQDPGDINKYSNVTDEQEPKEFFTKSIVTDCDTDADMGLNDYAIFKKEFYFWNPRFSLGIDLKNSQNPI